MLRQQPEERYASIDELKTDLLSRHAQDFSRQKLERLRKRVVPRTEPDDPLIDDPIRITSYDWRDGVLELELQQEPSVVWIREFRGQPAAGYSGIVTDAVKFNDRLARLPVREDWCSKAYRLFEGWLAGANARYAAACAANPIKNEAARLLKNIMPWSPCSAPIT